MKKFFIAGLLVWAPLAITIWVIFWTFTLLDGIFSLVLNTLSTVLPKNLEPTLIKFLHLPGVGIGLILLGILVTGAFAANIFGQWALRQWDKLLARIPIVKSIYSSVKQVFDTVFATDSHAFSKTLLIQYPRPGIWAIAFLTGTPDGNVRTYLQNDYISVYLPTTPNPTSGFFLMLPRADAIELNISVDEALKYIVSMGVVPPKTEHPHI